MSKTINKVLLTGAIITAIGIGTYLVLRPNTASWKNPIRVKIDEVLNTPNRPKGGAKSPLEKLASNIKANLRKLFGMKKKKKKKKDNQNNNNNNQTDYGTQTNDENQENQDEQNTYGIGGDYNNQTNEYGIGGSYGWDIHAQYGTGEYSVRDIEQTIENY